jgi:hypothetical protein
MVVEGGVAAQRGDHRAAGRCIEAHRHAQDGVDTFARHHIGKVDAQMIGDGGAQIMVFRIAIMPALGRGCAHGGQHRWRWAKRAFIGADSCAQGHAAPSHDRLGPDKGHGLIEAGGDGRKGRTGHGCDSLFGSPLS